MKSTTGDHLRPIMTNLNGDSSWLISFPRPTAERDALGKAYYHVALEPWLTEPGEIVLLARWFDHVQRNCVAAATDGAAVDALVREIEYAAGSSNQERAGVDAIIVAHTNEDHMHRETLVTFSPSIPVFTGPGVSQKITEWNYFELVIDMGTFGTGVPSWRENHPGPPLPGWLSFISLELRDQNFGIAMVWTHRDNEGSGDNTLKHESILYFPHSWHAHGEKDRRCVEDFLVSDPPLHTLAIMHPLKEVIVWGITFATGVKAGIQLWRSAKPTHWLNTGDHEILLSGLFMKGVWCIRHTLAWGLYMERLGKGQSGSENENGVDKPNFTDLDNGYNYVLE